METNQLLINYYKKEELKKIKNWKQEGKVNAEIIRLANKEYISVEEIREALGIDEDEIIETEEKGNVVDKFDIVIEDEEDNIENEKEPKSNIVIIDDDKLEDYPNQPFKMYDEDKKEEMMESIRINGIMQPLIVRSIDNGKYQILAGHNRRYCGREIGMKKFECIVKENLTDDEARIYLVDTNLCTRDKISAMERAKAYKIKYDTYRRRKIETSIMEEIEKDNIRESLIKTEKSSNGTIQRYLRLTCLTNELQKLVDKEKVSINVGEKLSFLPNVEQDIIAELLLNTDIKITDNVAKRIKKQSENYKREDIYNYLGKEEILDLIKGTNQIKEIKYKIITVNFYKEEIERYFKSLRTEEQIKDYIFTSLERLEDTESY